MRPFRIACIIAALLCVGGFFIGMWTGLYVATTCVVLLGFYIFITRRRYDSIEKLSGQIDSLLHGVSQSISSNCEGELSVLQTEISKMAIRLNEQADALTKDKVYLRDSIADISHQLRTPLTSLNLMIPRLQKQDLPLEERMALTREIRALLSRFDWLISALLKTSKIESGTVDFKSEPVNVAKLIESSMEPLVISAELRGVEILTHIAPEANYLGDHYWTSEAITNILKNCIEHTPDGGSITVSATENPVCTEIVISDTGEGIDESELPRIFERFYQGKNNSAQNFGIGLSLARMIISEQGGTIVAKNNDECGTSFVIKFYKGAV